MLARQRDSRSTRSAAEVIGRLLLALGAGWSVVSHGTAAAAASPPAPSFRLEVLPALTKAGCNAGRCHGSPSGKGGFALSLRGYDAQADWGQIARHLGGRRLDSVSPGHSLLVGKAVGEVPHGGGKRWSRGEFAERLVTAWIAAGAPFDGNAAAPVALELRPSNLLLEPGAPAPRLRAIAKFADGAERDVTDLALLSSSREEVGQAAPDGVVSIVAAGETTVAASYASLQAVSRVAFLPPAEAFFWPNLPQHNEVDRWVDSQLQRLRISPAPACDDATFLRRAFLDVCGVLPTAAEAREFLADARADKRERLVDSLLARPEHVDYWAMKWADLLGCNQRFVGKTGAIKYHAWIRHQIAIGVPENELARKLLTSAGGNYSRPAASFYRLPRTAEDRSEHVAQLFMGVRIGCARCHNHPGESWTQDDYYGLAAFFAQLKYRDGPFFNHQYDKEETVSPTRSGDVLHPRTGQAAAPRLLGATGPVGAFDGDRREQFAAWLTSPDNPYFAAASVNRLWQQLLGRGIVEPVDDFRVSNPPSHPELLAGLAREFIAAGFDRRPILRKILLSRAYQAESSPAAGAAALDDGRYFSYYSVRLLGAETLLDAIGQATGVREKFAGLPLGARAADLPDGELPHRFLNAFGRPARSMACACERDDNTNLAQALELVGKTVESKVQSPAGSAARLAATVASDEALLEELWLTALSRLPTPAERRVAGQRLQTADRAAAVQDLLWALVNHREFLFRH